MRRIFLASLVSLLLIQGQAQSATQFSKTYTSVNTNASTIKYVSTSTIIPGVHKILGFTVIPVAGATAGAWVALYDATTSAQLGTANLYGEAECVANTSQNKIFPYPKSISSGLCFVQSPESIVIVDYTR